MLEKFLQQRNHRKLTLRERKIYLKLIARQNRINSKPSPKLEKPATFIPSIPSDNFLVIPRRKRQIIVLRDNCLNPSNSVKYFQPSEDYLSKFYMSDKTEIIGGKISRRVFIETVINRRELEPYKSVKDSGKPLPKKEVPPIERISCKPEPIVNFTKTEADNSSYYPVELSYSPVSISLPGFRQQAFEKELYYHGETIRVAMKTRQKVRYNAKLDIKKIEPPKPKKKELSQADVIRQHGKELGTSVEKIEELIKFLGYE